jgi:hypothetical protein
MGLFGSGKTNSKIDNIQVTESSQGRCIGVILGQNRVHQTLLWSDGLVAWESTAGGKGQGKGGQPYIYAADVIAALANGPITSIGSVWAGQSHLSNLASNEAVTISSVYAPANATLLTSDLGVAFATTFSSTYNDLGAPAATVLSGSDFTPLLKVPYGTALTTGEYSVNPISIGTFTLTSCANNVGGLTTVYNGTFTGGTSPYGSGASNNYQGFQFVVAGFSNPANDGIFTCTASTTTQLTLNNPLGVAQTSAATAAESGYSYHFSSADIGKAGVVSYQFGIQNLQETDVSLVPASGVITVGGNFHPMIDQGVWYYSTSGVGSMVALTAVSGTPTAAGTYHFSTPGTGSGGGANYNFYTAGGTGGDLGQEILMSWQYQNLSLAQGNTPNLLNFELFSGGLSQAVWPYMLTGGSTNLGDGSEPSEPAFPGAALGYSNTAYLGYGPMALNTSGEIQDILLEVITPFSYGGLYSSGPNAGQAIVDCNPCVCLFQVLTNSVWGLGGSIVPFPVGCIDSVTWGNVSASPTPGARTADNSTASSWFISNNYFISPFLDSQESAASVMGKWLEAGACNAYYSEGLLKLVPLGTQSTAGNGVTWVAPQAVVTSLDDTCFVSKEGADPVQITRTAWQDAINCVQVKWTNRAYQYSDELTQESDQALINRYGLRLGDADDYPFICNLSAATFAANMKLKRAGNIRNTYKFTLPYSYSFIEPCDLLSITISSVWAAGLNNENLDIVNLTVRVTKVVDDPVKGLEITAEDSLFQSGLPSIYTKGTGVGGGEITNQYLQPGNSTVVFFEPGNQLSDGQPNEFWFGAVGQTENWGSCNVWAAQGTGTTYVQIGSITKPARLGTLAAVLPSHTSPDTTNSLIVNVSPECAALEAGTLADAVTGQMNCFCDGEIIGITACAVSAVDQYTMGTELLRGVSGSTIGSHAIGSNFLRLDNSIFKYRVHAAMAGTSISFKFQSVNSFGQCAQALSSLTPVVYTFAGSGLPVTVNFPTTGPITGPPGRPIHNGDVFNANTGGGSFSLPLPSAASLPNGSLIVSKASSDANTVTLAAASGDTIGFRSSVVLGQQNSAVQVVSDGVSNWIAIGGGGSGGASSSYGIGCTFDGPLPPSLALVVIPLDQTVTFASGLAPSQGVLQTATTNSIAITLAANGTSFGTMTFAASGTVATFSGAGGTFSAGTIISATTPATIDPTASNLGFLISGQKVIV